MCTDSHRSADLIAASFAARDAANSDGARAIVQRSKKCSASLQNNQRSGVSQSAQQGTTPTATVHVHWTSLAPARLPASTGTTRTARGWPWKAAWITPWDTRQWTPQQVAHWRAQVGGSHRVPTLATRLRRPPSLEGVRALTACQASIVAFRGNGKVTACAGVANSQCLQSRAFTLSCYQCTTVP